MHPRPSTIEIGAPMKAWANALLRCFWAGLVLLQSVAAVGLVYGQSLPVRAQSSRSARNQGGSVGAKGTAGGISFSDELTSTRIKFVLRNSVTPERYSIETMTGGVALFDYNNDGLLDIFFTNGATIPAFDKKDPAYWNRLYRNNGDGTFTDVTVTAGLAGVGYSMGVAAGDYDNDGFVDLYVTGFDRNQLFHNNGDGTFTDVTAKAHVGGVSAGGVKAWSVTSGWIDYNNDGKLDLFVVNYLNYKLDTAAHCVANKLPAYCAPNDFQGTSNILYRNNGDGTFTDVSAESHIDQYVGKGMGVAFADYDGDGLEDIFVSNDTFPNYLFHNNGDGTFTDVAAIAQVAYTDNGKTVAGMGADFRDLNNDGLPDIFHTAMFGDSFPLYQNLGAGQFADVTTKSGLTSETSTVTAWGTGIFDFDNDGNKDIFTADAAIQDNAMAVEHRPYALVNRVFRNVGKMTFEDVVGPAGSSMSVAAAHRGSAFGDLNGDGKIDAVVTILNGPPEILVNKTQNNNHWLLINLIGVADNRDGLGTKVKIVTAGGSQYNEATTAVGYNSSSDKKVHFGLGSDTVIERIELTWPTGIKQVLTNIRVDQVLTITESAK
jgi:peptidoglycan hydrolase-like protein with peptidoglycan-binding domain